jgi:NAD-dependent SIR2 family protein deacetylase
VTTKGEPSSIARAADAIASATALLVTAGAGMGVDSGLPDFRGNEGFWKAYPPYQRLGLSFIDLANPNWFVKDPAFAWGFYGHRLELYRRTKPHRGFAILRRWMDRMASGGFVFTSNVDGAFQRAGVDADRIHECHGALDWIQCTKDCGAAPFAADGFTFAVDPETFRAAEPWPTCPSCGALGRPNLLMFDDYAWDSARYDEQRERLGAWLADVRANPSSRVVVVECGAGTAIPTVREKSERIAHLTGGALVRINVREHQVPKGHMAVSMGALSALETIDAALAK